MAPSTSAQSSALRASGPSLSSDQQSVIAPVRLTRPKVGRSPVTPQTVAGETIDPSVSDPMANGTSPAATAAADPAEEPLDPLVGFQGLRVIPPNHTSPIASSPKLSFATSTAPAASSFRMTVASASGTWLVNGGAPQVVRIPRVSRRSFAPYGIPWSGPRR